MTSVFMGVATVATAKPSPCPRSEASPALSAMRPASVAFTSIASSVCNVTASASENSARRRTRRVSSQPLTFTDTWPSLNRSSATIAPTALAALKFTQLPSTVRVVVTTVRLMPPRGAGASGGGGE
jgi:hypothetical protein